MVLDNLLIGIFLGLSAGFAPGPLLALVITETIQYDIKAGFKVAIAPVITDLPIILITLFLLSKLSSFNIVLAMISFLGAALIFYMGYESLQTQGMDIDAAKPKPKSLKKGVIINLLSPHPYLFWISIGSPILIKAANKNLIAAIAFIAGFYIFLICSKVLLAVVTGKSKYFLKTKLYLYIMKILGFALIGFAILLVIEGIKFLY